MSKTRPEGSRRLSILDANGDTELTWDPSDVDSVAEARRTVEDLRQQGYSFFLVDGTPADAVTAGNGTLHVRRVEAEALLTAPIMEPAPDEPVASVPPDVAPHAKKGRSAVGRPVLTHDEAVAVRPMRGG